MKNKIIILLLSLTTVWFASCFDDKSNAEWEMVNPIIVDYNGSDGRAQISVGGYSLEELSIAPIVYKEGTSDASLSFRWTIEGAGIKKDTVGTQQSLKLLLKYPPMLTPYNLILNIRDNETGIERNVHFLVKVTGQFEQGLVIADTKDEMTSDLHLVMSQNFNSAIKFGDEKVFKNVYSQVNGTPINGLVTDLLTKSFQNDKTLTVITKNDVIRASHADYMRLDHECGINAFIIPPETMAPEKCFFEVNAFTEYMICGGRLYSRSCQNNNRKFGYYLYAPGRLDCNITTGFMVLNIRSNLNQKSWFWDAKKSCFLICQNAVISVPKDQTSTLFDVNNMQGWEPVFFGHVFTSSKLHIIMREIATGALSDHVVDVTNPTTSTDLALDLIPLSGIQGIDKAKMFASNVLENQIYYSDGKTVNSYSFANQKVNVQYTPEDSNAIITNIQICDFTNGKIRYKDLNPSSITGYLEISAQNKMAMITTYNEITKEGKVVLVPIPYLGGIWEQDRSFHVVLGGYGRILKIAKQDS